jgi:hypothetical protein
VPGIVITAALLSALPHAFETRTQYEVVCVSGGDVNCDPLAPATGFDVSGGAPWYQMNVSGCDPLAPTVSVVVCPELIVVPAGSTVITGF